MGKPRRTLPATELRVHLGEALRALEAEDLVIEKGGVPVALLVKYRGESQTFETAASSEYERALSHRAEPAGWQRMDGVMASGWAGIEAEELAANVYRWRAEGAQPRHFSFDDPAQEEADERDVPDRQRRLHPRRSSGKRVADGDDPGYSA